MIFPAVCQHLLKLRTFIGVRADCLSTNISSCGNELLTQKVWNLLVWTGMELLVLACSTVLVRTYPIAPFIELNHPWLADSIL